MTDFLNNLLFFIIAIGVLVTFHEFGHYWVARKLGVKVLRFSVGFGRPLFTHKRITGGDEVEFVVSAIPLGGYVKMLDEKVEDVDETEKHRAFNNQSLSIRSAIVFAGPAFNFILAILLYWFVFVHGVDAIKPVLDQPAAGTIAALSGFTAEDEVIDVNGKAIKTMNDFRLALIDEGVDGGSVPITVINAKQTEVTRQLNIGDMKILKEEGDAIEKMGFKLWSPVIPADIGSTVKDSVAEKAGLMADDRILAINNHDIESWKDAVSIISQNPGKQINITVLRGDVEQTLPVIPASRTNKAGEEEGFIGVYLKSPEWLFKRLKTEEIHSPIAAIGVSVQKTWDMSVLTLKVLGKMLTGDAALENISGPITIAQYAGVTASIGLVQFLSFLAVISISLGVLNLLPVPVLDGGHLLYYLLEFIKGSPLSEKAEYIGQQLGMALLLLLMSVAIFNDLQRLIS